MSSSRPRSRRFPLVLARLVLAAAAASAGACGSSSTSVVAPTTQKCQISVTGFTAAFGAGGGSGSATIDAARECSWSAAVQAGWIALTPPTEGTGAGKVTFTVGANTAPRARSGALTVNGQQLTVSQEAAPCRFSVAPTSVQLEAVGGTASVAVTATDASCGWTAASQAPWIAVSGGSAGSGSGGVSLSVAPNTGAARSGVVTVAGQAVSITQAATPAPTPPGACQVAVTPSTLTFAASGGEDSLQVSTATECAWQATTTAAWLTLAPTAGARSGTLTVTAAANTDTASRSASIIVGGSSAAVTQAGAAVPSTVQLTGSVDHRRGGCPVISFTVQDTSVVTTADTVFSGETCDKLKNGDSVIVDGLQTAGQPVVATRVTSTGG
jgi:hypothetical protein